MDWRRIFRSQRERNAEILRRYEAGESQCALAREYGVTRQRVWAICRREREREAMGS